MTWHDHPRASHIVRRHWRRSQAFILALRRPCIEIRDEELLHVGGNRLLAGGTLEDLAAWRRPASWFIAVVVCAGDDTDGIADHVNRHGLDPSRVHFYLHEEASPQALAAWHAAGLPLERVSDSTQGGKPITDWASLHKVLGLHFNNQIVQDFLEAQE